MTSRSREPDPQAIRAATWIVVPAYGEAEAIGDVVARLTGDRWRVVVIDDGSADDTASRASDAGAWVIRHAINLGQGAALATGFAFALRDPGTEFVVTFDGDGQHDFDAVARMIEPLASDEADVVLGSRFLDETMTHAIPATRKALLRLATRLARLTTRLRLTDTHNGMRAFRRTAVERLVLRQDRMAHASEILAEIARLRLRYRETPVHVVYTQYSLHKGQRLLDAISVVWDLVAGKAR